MDPVAQARRAAVLFLFGTVAALGQSTLPATSPTSVPAVPAASLPAVPAAPRAVPAKVSWADGKLAVTADNSSLNQILREVGRLTGMTVTGGVAEQRVFGHYGPGSLAQIIGDLLEGTGSNMILRETSSGVAELILSPRVGGVTPPNPNAAAFDEAGADGPLPANGNANPAALNQVPPVPAPRPAYDPPPPISMPNGYPAPTDVPQPAPTTSAPSSPPGPLTPAQIYQQLQQLQKTQPQP